MAGTQLTFLPWVRQGAASLIPTPDNIAGPLEARVNLPITVGLNTKSPGGGTEATLKLRLYGPGDILSLDTRQVIRVEPLPNTANFEPNYFPFIEFDRPDLPWLFTPASHDGSNHLRPWICLVVLPKDQATIMVDPSRPLPFLRIPQNASAELPDLSESWAWAHAQVAGTDVSNALKSKPELTLSRLVCTRHLKPNGSYIAAVVPTFNVGVSAGLGQKQDDKTIPNLGPAWNSSTTAIDLPVYYHWEFATGEGGDFEELVTQLKRVAGTDVAGLGTREVRVVNAGGGLPDILDNSNPPEPKAIALGGALVPASVTDPSYPKDFESALRELINFRDVSTSLRPLPPDLVIPPPLYGRWHAAQSTIPAPAGSRDFPWLRELNLKLHFRVPASVGTQIVQEKQEELMTSAWEQVGAVEQANQLLRQAQLARDSSSTRFSGLKALPDESLLILAGPVLSRVMVGPEKRTAQATIELSRVPLACVQGAFRRIARSRGPIARRIVRAGGDTSYLPGRLLARINSLPSIVQPRVNPSGMMTVQNALDRVFGPGQQLKFCKITSDLIKARVRALGRPLTAEEETLFDSLSSHQRGMAPCAPLEPPQPKPKLNVKAIAEALGEKLNPEKTIVTLISSLVTAPGWSQADPLTPIMAAPEFPTPMYRALAALSQDYLLPGLEHLPNNSITGVKTNPAFINAFMVGLNHEMSRELLWREYPTDQRGTYFRQFWDPSTRVPPPSTTQDIEDAKDIDRINQWSLTTALSGAAKKSVAPTNEAKIVLVIRGELIRRYPGAAVYVVQGEWYQRLEQGKQVWRRQPKTATPEERYPLFQGSLEPDVTFMGFDLSPTDAVGRAVNANGNPIDETGQEIANPDKAGWFVVLQQQPTEPRLGLDETGKSPASSWNDLGWDRVQVKNNHLKLSDGLIDFVPEHPDEFTPTWPPATSAVLATITLQGPFRAAIHLSDLLGARRS